MFDFFLDLIYPRTCGICGQIHKEYLCKKCEKRLEKLSHNKIYKSKLEPISYHAYAFPYEGEIREKLITYKFHEQAYIYQTFIKIILKSENLCGFMKKYDIIIPISIHRKRKKQRGYDQTVLIAKEIAKELKINIRLDILIKQNNIQPQSSLDKWQRRQNIKNAYKLQNEQVITNQRILLIDDIYTTGATIQECARTLKKAKPKEIAAFTLAKD